ncbi:hypothetical protein B296_00018944, partial [Ensete ventricosum]
VVRVLVSQDMGIETPIPISMKLRDHNDVFRRIVSAAQQPHLSIPETEAGKSRKQYRPSSALATISGASNPASDGCVDQSDTRHIIVFRSLFLLNVFVSITSHFVLSYASTHYAYNVVV